jgi:bifunctional UDP-N-acetylglucosamine pyrophosphorylase/glucosamine-1-phosphate N-acetyltransferase
MSERSALLRRRPPHAVILGAGKGKRMRSERAKVLHPIAGRPMIDYVVRAALRAGAGRICVILGNQAAEVRRALAPHARRLTFCLQREQKGTGHAVLMASRHLAGLAGDALILNGDVPAVRGDLLRRLVQEHRARGAALTLVTAHPADPTGYGRIVRDPSGGIARVVEERDARPEEREIREINCGLYVVDCGLLFPALRRLTPANAQREIYLTDLVRLLRADGHRVAALPHGDAEEVLGVNTRRELAAAGRLLHARKAEALMERGVTFLDPDHTYVDSDVRVGPDTILYPAVHLRGRTRIGRGCSVEPGCVIRDSVLGDGVRVLPHSVITASRLRDGAQVGPFAHLRPQSDIGARARIGNFVEVKKSRIGEEVKAGHLSYLGDARLGRRVNVGAGTITCNYDGRRKHVTVLEDDVFIGSDTQLVAPVRVRRGAYVGAGTTVTRDVPAGALALSRAPQQNREGWVRLRRAADEGDGRRRAEGRRRAARTGAAGRRRARPGA